MYAEGVRAAGLAKAAVGAEKASLESFASMMQVAGSEVLGKKALSVAPREALEAIGLNKAIGLFVPGTGRLGRWVRADRLLDAVSGGRVTAARAKQVERVPLTKAIWDPDPTAVKGIRHDIVENLDEWLAREGLSTADEVPRYFAAGEIRERMAQIATGGKIEQLGDPLLTQAAQMARVSPVEAVKFGPWTGRIVQAVGGAPGAVMRNVFLRSKISKDRSFLESFEKTISNQADLRRVLSRSRDPQSVLTGLEMQRSNLDGWRVRSTFIHDFAVRLHEIQDGAATQLDDPVAWWEFFNKEIRAFDAAGNPTPVMKQVETAEGVVEEVFDGWKWSETLLEDPQWGPWITNDARLALWTQQRQWWDDILEAAHESVGEHTEFLQRLAEDLYVARFADADFWDQTVVKFQQPTEPRPVPTLPRQYMAGEEMHGVPLVADTDQFSIPIRKNGAIDLSMPRGEWTDLGSQSLVEQIRLITRATFGDQAQELFERDVWKVMDRYMHVLADEVRRQHVMYSLENRGVMFRPLTPWLAGEKRIWRKVRDTQKGVRDEAFDSVFDELETALDPLLAAETRAAYLKALGGSELEEVLVRFNVEAEGLEGLLVAAYRRLVDESDLLKRTVGAGLVARKQVAQFVRAFLEEAYTLMARKHQIQQALQAIRLEGGAGATSEISTQLLADIDAALEGMASLLKAATSDTVKTIVEYDQSVTAANEIWQLLSWSPEFGGTGIAREAINAGVAEMIPWKNKVNEIRSLVDEVDYGFVMEPMTSPKLLQGWMRKLEMDQVEVGQYYSQMLKRQGKVAWQAEQEAVTEIVDAATALGMTPAEFSALAHGGYPTEMYRIVDEWGQELGGGSNHFPPSPVDPTDGPAGGLPLSGTSPPFEASIDPAVAKAGLVEASRVTKARKVAMRWLRDKEGVYANPLVREETLPTVSVSEPQLQKALLKVLGGGDRLTVEESMMDYLLYKGSVKMGHPAAVLESPLHPVPMDVIDAILQAENPAARTELVDFLRTSWNDLTEIEGTSPTLRFPFETYAELLWVRRWLKQTGVDAANVRTRLGAIETAIIHTADPADALLLKGLRQYLTVKPARVPPRPLPDTLTGLNPLQMRRLGVDVETMEAANKLVEQVDKLLADMAAKVVAAPVGAVASKRLRNVQAAVAQHYHDPFGRIGGGEGVVEEGLRKIVLPMPRTREGFEGYPLKHFGVRSVRGGIRQLWESAAVMQQHGGPSIGVAYSDTGAFSGTARMRASADEFGPLKKTTIKRIINEVRNEGDPHGRLNEFVEYLTEGGIPNEVFVTGNSIQEVALYEFMIQAAKEANLLPMEVRVEIPEFVQFAREVPDAMEHLEGMTAAAFRARVRDDMNDWYGGSLEWKDDASVRSMITNQRMNAMRQQMKTLVEVGEEDSEAYRAIRRRMLLVDNDLERLPAGIGRLFEDGVEYLEDVGKRGAQQVVAVNLRNPSIVLMGRESDTYRNAPLYLHSVDRGTANPYVSDLALRAVRKFLINRYGSLNVGGRALTFEEFGDLVRGQTPQSFTDAGIDAAEMGFERRPASVVDRATGEILPRAAAQVFHDEAAWSRAGWVFRKDFVEPRTDRLGHIGPLDKALADRDLALEVSGLPLGGDLGHPTIWEGEFGWPARQVEALLSDPEAPMYDPQIRELVEVLVGGDNPILIIEDLPKASWRSATLRVQLDPDPNFGNLKSLLATDEGRRVLGALDEALLQLARRAMEIDEPRDAESLIQMLNQVRRGVFDAMLPASTPDAVRNEVHAVMREAAQKEAANLLMPSFRGAGYLVRPLNAVWGIRGAHKMRVSEFLNSLQISEEAAEVTQQWAEELLDVALYPSKAELAELVTHRAEQLKLKALFPDDPLLATVPKLPSRQFNTRGFREDLTEDLRATVTTPRPLGKMRVGSGGVPDLTPEMVENIVGTPMGSPLLKETRVSGGAIGEGEVVQVSRIDTGRHVGAIEYLPKHVEETVTEVEEYLHSSSAAYFAGQSNPWAGRAMRRPVIKHVREKFDVPATWRWEYTSDRMHPRVGPITGEAQSKDEAMLVLQKIDELIDVATDPAGNIIGELASGIWGTVRWPEVERRASALMGEYPRNAVHIRTVSRAIGHVVETAEIGEPISAAAMALVRFLGLSKEEQIARLLETGFVDTLGNVLKRPTFEGERLPIATVALEAADPLGIVRSMSQQQQYHQLLDRVAAMVIWKQSATREVVADYLGVHKGSVTGIDDVLEQLEQARIVRKTGKPRPSPRYEVVQPSTDAIKQWVTNRSTMK